MTDDWQRDYPKFDVRLTGRHRDRWLRLVYEGELDDGTPVTYMPDPRRTAAPRRWLRRFKGATE